MPKVNPTNLVSATATTELLLLVLSMAIGVTARQTQELWLDALTRELPTTPIPTDETIPSSYWNNVNALLNGKYKPGGSGAVTDSSLPSKLRFTVGQTIVIEDGTPRREVNTITGFGSITLEIPCKFDHPAGATITAEAEVVPQGLKPSSILSPAPAPAPSDDDSDRPPSIEGVPGVCKEEVEELKEKLDKALKNTLLTSMHSLLHRNGFSVDNHDIVAMEDFHAVLLQSSTSANSTAWDKPLAAARSAICSPPALGGTAVMGRPSALRGNSPRARSALRFVKNHFL